LVLIIDSRQLSIVIHSYVFPGLPLFRIWEVYLVYIITRFPWSSAWILWRTITWR